MLLAAMLVQRVLKINLRFPGQLATVAVNFSMLSGQAVWMYV
jgi:hypothetical protein